MIKRIPAFLLAIVFAFGVCIGAFDAVAYAVNEKEQKTAVKNSLTKVDDLKDRDNVTIMVELDGETALQKSDSGVKGSLKYTDIILKEQLKAKKSVEKAIQDEINVKSNYTLLFNGFAFDGTVDMISKINAIDGLTAFVAPRFDVPKTATSNEIIHAVEMWNMGYTGKGTAIAVLDTGIMAEHEAFSVAPPSPKFDEKAIADIYEQYGEYMHAGSNVRKLYESAKIPFAYDYYLSRYGAEHCSSSDHGTHVAGIAAGNNGKDFKGTAYDAQIFAMQVFTVSGGAQWDCILLALEDCAYLGVDSVNMSLGSPAGFSAYYEESYSHVFELLKAAGVAISASAGNEGSTAISNRWGGYQLSSNPDSGLVGSPSTWSECLSVASSDNASVSIGSIKVGNYEFGYLDPQKGTDLSFDKLNGKYEYVICGLGTAEDFKDIDLTGKIAVISRGGITFTEKAQNAKNAGAEAAVIYNNQEGVINMSIETEIPAVSILLADGEKLIENAKDNVGTLTVKQGTFIDYTSAENISTFSSVGTTADLKIKPEITAPGGNITSCIGFGEADSYETWSGTSMAAPHVAGGLAVIKQYVAEKFPNKTAAEQLDIAYAILMSTATPLKEELVRSQGAGLMNMEAALTSNAYLSVKNSNRPKLELDEISGKTFTLTFRVNNFGENAITYNVNTTVDIDTPYEAGEFDGKTVYFTNLTPFDITGYCDIVMPEIVTVEAGKYKDISVKVTLHNDIMQDIEAIFDAGTFIEGFVTLIPKATNEGVQESELSIPYLGFLGDWDYAAMIDDGYYWQSAENKDNLYSNPELPYNYIGYSWDSEDLLYGAGINPYGDGTMPEGSFSYDRIAVSPGVSDIDYMAFSMLRNTKSLKLYLTDDSGNILKNIKEYDDYMWKKEFLYGETYTYSDIAFDIDLAEYKENETVHVVLETELDHEGFSVKDNANAVWNIPITVDRIAPFITGTKYNNGTLTLKALDTNYIARIAVYSDAQLQNEISEKLYYSNMRSAEETLKLQLDKENTKLVYILLSDYAGNERLYVFNTSDKTLLENRDTDDYSKQIIAWSESFEDSSSYGGWDTIDADEDGNDWIIGNDKDLASDGNCFAASYSYDANTDTELEPDNLIISSAVQIPDDGQNYKLSFDVAAADYEEAFGVYIGTADSTDINDYDNLYYSAINGSKYKTVTIDLSGYAGEEVRFAWRHFDCAGGNFIRLDNIKLYYLDAFTDNDPVYAESFEGSHSWTVYDADGDGDGFKRIKNANLASDGSYAMFSKAYNADTYEQLKVDNWLISDAVKLPASPALSYLSYDVISALNGHDRYEVYVGTSKDVSKMTSLLYSAEATNDWTAQRLNLTAYAGKTVYIAFRHVCDNGMMLGVDNIKIQKIDRKPEYMVTFRSGYTDEILGLSRYEEGTVITGFPRAPEYEDYTFIGWNYDGKALTKDITIRAEYRPRGDVNMDEVLNTNDAVTVLRIVAYETELTEAERKLADFNRDGKVNTGDAVAILKYIIGMKSNG